MKTIKLWITTRESKNKVLQTSLENVVGINIGNPLGLQELKITILNEEGEKENNYFDWNKVVRIKSKIYNYYSEELVTATIGDVYIPKVKEKEE